MVLGLVCLLWSGPCAQVCCLHVSFLSRFPFRTINLVSSFSCHICFVYFPLFKSYCFPFSFSQTRSYESCDKDYTHRQVKLNIYLQYACYVPLLYFLCKKGGAWKPCPPSPCSVSPIKIIRNKTTGKDWKITAHRCNCILIPSQ